MGLASEVPVGQQPAARTQCPPLRAGAGLFSLVRSGTCIWFLDLQYLCDYMLDEDWFVCFPVLSRGCPVLCPTCRGFPGRPDSPDTALVLSKD